MLFAELKHCSVTTVVVLIHLIIISSTNRLVHAHAAPVNWRSTRTRLIAIKTGH